MTIMFSSSSLKWEKPTYSHAMNAGCDTSLLFANLIVSYFPICLVYIIFNWTIRACTLKLTFANGVLILAIRKCVFTTGKSPAMAKQLGRETAHTVCSRSIINSHKDITMAHDDIIFPDWHWQTWRKGKTFIKVRPSSWANFRVSWNICWITYDC